MKQLLGLLFLMGLVQAQTFSGTSGGDIFILPPFRSCLGADNGGQACFIQEGSGVAKLTGRLHATLGTQLGPVTFANLATGTNATNGSALTIKTADTSGAQVTPGLITIQPGSYGAVAHPSITLNPVTSTSAGAISIVSSNGAGGGISFDSKNQNSTSFAI